MVNNGIYIYNGVYIFTFSRNKQRRDLIYIQQQHQQQNRQLNKLLRQTKCQQPIWHLRRHVTRQLWNHKRRLWNPKWQLLQPKSQLDLLLCLPEVKQQLKSQFLYPHTSWMLQQRRQQQIFITCLDYLKCLEKKNWPLNYWGIWSKCSNVMFIGGITVIPRLRRYDTFRCLKLGTCNYCLTIKRCRKIDNLRGLFILWV